MSVEMTEQEKVERRRCWWRNAAIRIRLRKKGIDVPLLKAGPKDGAQLPHLRGENANGWKGDEVKFPRRRARAAFPNLGKCERCDKPAVLRHHTDGSTLNNEPDNIELLCESCHHREHWARGAWANRKRKKKTNVG